MSMQNEVQVKKSGNLKLIEIDPWLSPYENDLRERQNRFFTALRHMIATHGSITNFASGHLYFGIHKTLDGWYYREWAPAAQQLYLVGDFNNWDRHTHPMRQVGNGAWEIFLDKQSYQNKFVSGTKLKVHVVANGHGTDRIPLYIKKVLQNKHNSEFVGQYWEENFQWSDAAFNPDTCQPLHIYEAHVGMSQDNEGIGTYLQFAELLLPRIKKSGYNAIQLMAIQEHPYYGSFGYQVANFFAPSSRFGTPEELKYLIDRAHNLGLAVLLDLVHSHAVSNINEGINQFDGTTYQFFHVGAKGDHPAWGSKLFDYGRMEVCHFLLSNVRYWLEEFHFDGFRFDGVTSMLYHHHGLGYAFDHYNKYFSIDTDVDAVLYLQLANALIREINEHAITIAEDMSAMPGMCIPIQDGGIGFNYRLSMGIPDFWIKTLRSTRDEDWDMNELWHQLTTRRAKEKTVAYAESHDQALVGDKTIAFWLMDAAMYWHMKVDDKNLEIDRGIALHKMIRLVTLALGGEAYLNFMGNEFGHPEWIDFPREGNGWSYKYAKRQWHLVDDQNLKFKYLAKFDVDILELSKNHNLLTATDLQQLWLCNTRKLLAFKKAELIFIFNFHPSYSEANFEFWLHQNNKYKIFLDSDQQKYGGHSRLNKDQVYATAKRAGYPEHSLKLYIPCRTAIVLAKT